MVRRLEKGATAAAAAAGSAVSGQAHAGAVLPRACTRPSPAPRDQKGWQGEVGEATPQVHSTGCWAAGGGHGARAAQYAGVATAKHKHGRCTHTVVVAPGPPPPASAPTTTGCATRRLCTHSLQTRHDASHTWRKHKSGRPSRCTMSVPRYLLGVRRGHRPRPRAPPAARPCPP